MLPLSDFKLRHNSFSCYGPKQSAWLGVGKVKIKLLLVTGLVLFTLFATQLVFAANLATDGARLVQIDQEIRNQEVQNANLKTEIARQASLANLQHKAIILGFSTRPKIITP